MKVSSQVLRSRRGRRPGDHHAKRIEIAEAACKVIARLGIAHAGLADFAREMGYTTGVLQHYFPDKEQLLLFAKNMLFDRAHESAVKAAENASGTDRLRTMLLAGMQITPDNIDRWRLLAIFNGRALGSSKLMQVQHKRNQRFWKLYEDELLSLQDQGELSSDMNVALEARGLIAFTDGLVDQVIMQPKAWSTQQLQHLTASYFDCLLTHYARGAPKLRGR